MRLVLIIDAAAAAADGPLHTQAPTHTSIYGYYSDSEPLS